MKITDHTLVAAYKYCQQIAQNHYENFPVASFLLPKKLRQPISAIYAFSRTADDFADEGDDSPQQRLHKLDNYSALLQVIRNSKYQGENPIFIALQHTINTHQLPITLFDDLLAAFKQDVNKTRFNTFDDILAYCKLSANPVGRLLLYLNGNPSAQQLQQSDSICTALQLINFYQDIIQDFSEQDRIYLPLDEFDNFHTSIHHLNNTDSVKLSKLLRYQHLRAQHILRNGIDLGISLSGRLGWEIRAITLAGMITLHQLMQQSDDRLLNRPRLTKLTMVRIIVLSSSKYLYQRVIHRLLN